MPETETINRLLLSNGGMFDTKLSEQAYCDSILEAPDSVEITICGVFGELLRCKRGAIVGFISREHLDQEAALAAQEKAMKMQQRSMGIIR